MILLVFFRYEFRLNTVYRSINCKNKINKEMSFFISHDDKKVNLNDYEIVIEDMNSLIYKGAYSAEIKVPGVEFCNDDNLSRIEILNFYAIDKKKKMVYGWSKKLSFNLLNYTKVFIKLNCNINGDTYKIKFDDELFIDNLDHLTMFFERLGHYFRPVSIF